jgi:hypothetical protein
MHTAYMRALFMLKAATSRELDGAQVGNPPDPAFAQAVANAMAARRNVLYSNPETCDHPQWYVHRNGAAHCATCDAEIEEEMGG